MTIVTVEEHTAVECNDCVFRGCTCGTTRDILKARTHTHVEETGHTVRWADGVTMGRGVTDAPGVTGDEE